MPSDQQHLFIQCCIIAGVTHLNRAPPGNDGVTALDEFIELELHNPLLDLTDDDPLSIDLSEAECNVLKDALVEKHKNLFVTELPRQKPPFRPVNHTIPLINETLNIKGHPHAMADKFKPQLSSQLNLWSESGLWNPAALESACALFAVPKPGSQEARFVINLKPRNANTRKMHTPLPDMTGIRNTLAAHPYRSKLDFKNAYEQIRIVPEHVKHSGFSTIFGTFTSNVAQQGDCNAPETMHRVCYMMFKKCIGRFIAGFYDDWFVYSHTRRAHLRYLDIVFTTLQHYKFYLSANKLDLFSPSLSALGAIITDDGISVDPTKWSKIASWPTPRNPKDILRFMGTVNWMNDHVPRLAELSAPLTRLTGKAAWNWTPACDFAFNEIKKLIPRTLQPLDWNKVESGEEKVYLFTDASVYGCGGWLGQGAQRDKARPFRFHSAKFNSAQKNYITTDQELLGVLDCTKKFRTHLLGRKFTVVSDHEPLKTYWTQAPKENRRQVRTWHELAEFDFDWEFIPGRKNTIADALSRLAELDHAIIEPAVDDNVDDVDEFLSISTSTSNPALLALLCANVIPSGFVSIPPSPLPNSPHYPLLPIISPLSFSIEPSELSLVIDSPSTLPPAARSVLISQLPAAFIDPLPDAYTKDSLCKHIVNAMHAHPNYSLVEGILFFEDRDGWRLVVPSGTTTSISREVLPPTLREAVISHAHRTLGHLGPAKTLAYIRRFFWWKTMHKDTFDYCKSCEPCSRGKSSSAAPFGLLHPNEIPRRPWNVVAMDFVVSLPPVPYRGMIVDSCLTVTDVLTKMVHIIPLPSTHTAAQVAEVYYDQIYRYHGLQSAIISDRDPKFTAGFWRALHRLIGTTLKMSTSAHPQTDGQSEVTNKTVGQILRILAEDNDDNWPSKTATVEFAINSAPTSTTSLSPFEISYGYLPTSWPVDSWTMTEDINANGYGILAKMNWLIATDALIATRVEMITQGNKHRRIDSPQFHTGNKVYVSTRDITFPEGMTRKLIPKFIGPYPITASFPSSSNYDIAFPAHMKIHSRFHASKLRPYYPNDAERFPSRSFSEPPPVESASDNNTNSYVIEKVVAHKLVGKKKLPHYLVRWLGYSSGEDTWISEVELRKTAAESVDDYLALLNARTLSASKSLPLNVKKRSRRITALLASCTSLPSTPFSGGVSARIARENRLLRVPIPFSLNMLSRFSFSDEVHALH